MEMCDVIETIRCASASVGRSGPKRNPRIASTKRRFLA